MTGIPSSFSLSRRPTARRHRETADDLITHIVSFAQHIPRQHLTHASADDGLHPRMTMPCSGRHTESA